MPTSGLLAPRSIVIDWGSAPDDRQIVFLLLSLMPSIAFAAVPLVAVSVASEYGNSICAPCAGRGARDAFMLQAAPTSPRRVTIAASSKPCRLGGQLSRKFVQRGSSTRRCWSTLALILVSWLAA